MIGIIIIAFLLFSMVYNMTKPTPQSSLNVVTDNESIGDNSYYPYQVNIVCDGSWAGQAGEPNHINYISGTGNKTIRLDCASWDNVTVSIEKVSGSLPLKVQLLRNGKVIAENSTDATGTAVVLNK
ncbi:MAG: hypothetical protein Q4P18_07620 [Methanobrevibacter sp.]|nr:hypothetical protein [Methanobrevibacter sp.]